MLCIDTQGALAFETSTFVGRSVGVLGITDSGKTNTVAVLIEELLGNLPMTIVDIEGEYWGLKERFDLLIAGRSEHAELEIGPENAAALAEISITRGISIILDLSDYSSDEQHAFLLAYFSRLWEVAGKERKPYQIVLEEAHEFIPQSASSPLKAVLTRIALRGRKRGLGIILASQRSAKVEKDVLTQVPLLFLHRVVHPIDVKVYKDLLPLPPARVEEMVGGLAQGQVIVLYQHAAQLVQIRRRATFHAGATPTLDAEAAPQLRSIDAATLEELRSMLAKSEDEANSPDDGQAVRIYGGGRAFGKQFIIELEKQMAAKDQEIAQLREQVAHQREMIEKLLDTQEALRRQVADQASASVAPKSPASPSLPPPPPLNERKFATLVKRLADLPGQERRILQVLVDHGEERLLPRQEIAAWLQVQEKTITGHPPMNLLRLHVIERELHDDGYRYRSKLRWYLAQEFPGQDIEALIKRLF